MATPTTSSNFPDNVRFQTPLKPDLPFAFFTPEPDPLPVYRSEVTLRPTSPIDLVLEDGEPLETFWHRDAMNLLIDCIDQYFRGRTDYVVGGNQFIYYNEHQARNIDYKGPDFFFVWGRPRHTERSAWVTWDEEGSLPNVIIELMSPSTRRVDLLSKKTLYQNTFKTNDYFCYDPFTGEFFGWTLKDGAYIALEPNANGWLWSNQLQLWLGLARCVFLNLEDVYLRFFTPEGGMVGSFAEAAQADAERAQAEAARALADAQRQRLRADAAEAELATLKAQLKAKDNPAS